MQFLFATFLASQAASILFASNVLWDSLERPCTNFMTQSGDPKENALAERVHKTIKEEFLNYCIHLNHETANKAVKKTIELYNEMRPHASIDYLTPAQAHR